MRSLAYLLLLALAAGCAAARLTEPPPAGQSSAPAKCAACHPAPRAHDVAPGKWEDFLRHHRRRIHLSDQEKATLHEFLVGRDLPADR
jgi:hypothetical protein